MPWRLSQLYTNWIFCDKNLQNSSKSAPILPPWKEFQPVIARQSDKHFVWSILGLLRGKGKAFRVVGLWYTGQKTKVTKIQGQSNLISFLPLVGEKSLLWSVAAETQMWHVTVAWAKRDAIIAVRGHGNTCMKDPEGSGCEVYGWHFVRMFAHVHGRLRASLLSHTFPFVHGKDWERGSSVNAKAEVEWHYQQSLLSTSPATGGSFIFPVCLLSHLIITDMDVSIEPMVLMGGTRKNN